MHRILGILIWLLVALGAQAQTVDQFLTALADISGMKALRPVPQARMTRDQLRVYFEKRLRDSAKPEQTRLEELTLKKLGLVPADFDLSKSVLDLLSEQAAAFYDYHSAKMVMLDDGSDAMEQMALVHELAHALADQHFKIEKFLGKVADQDEATLARQAVVEGQAQWLMSEYMARQMGQSLLTSPALANLLAGGVDPSGQFPVYDQAPLYLRESLLFPYSAGMQFQQAVVAKLGPAGFARVFEKPPTSSREILHPALYLDPGSEAVPLLTTAPDIADGPDSKKAWKEVAEGVVGEFDHRVLLRLYALDAMPLAADWRAGRYRLWENRRTKSVALTYAARWGSNDTAQRYFAAYRRVLEGKWADLRVELESSDTLRGYGGGGWFEVKLVGDQVISREGLSLSTLKR